MRKLFFIFSILISAIALEATESEKPVGEGLKDDPYQIASYQNLLWLSENAPLTSNAYLVLTEDIEALESYNEKDYFTGINGYGVHFDGQGHSLTRLNCNLNGTTIKGALFSDLKNASVSNVFLSSVYLSQNINDSILSDISFVLTNRCYYLAYKIKNSAIRNITAKAALFIGSHYTLPTACFLATNGSFCQVENIKTEGVFEGTINGSFGLFGLCEDCEFRNLESDVTIHNTNGSNNGGGAAAGSAKRCTASSVKAKLRFPGHGSYGGVGGVFGTCEYCDISGDFDIDVFSHEFYSGGLSARASDCKIHDIKIKANVSAREMAGGLLGYGCECVMENIEGKVAVAAEDYAAGILGDGYIGEIIHASVEGELTATNFTGGIIGYSREYGIRNCKADANLSSKYTGGLIAVSQSDLIMSSYFSGFAPGTAGSGGIIGYLPYEENPSYAYSCYFSFERAATNGYGTAVSSDELKKEATFEDWDFENIWQIEEDVTTPFFRIGSDDTNVPSRVFYEGFSQSKITLGGVLTEDDISAIKEHKEISLFSQLTDKAVTHNYSLRENEKGDLVFGMPKDVIYIVYKKKKRCLSFTTADVQITLGVFNGHQYRPCELSTPTTKLQAKISMIDDIEDMLRSGELFALGDVALENDNLGGTYVTLSMNGNSLFGKSVSDDVTINAKINLKNRKVKIKYSSSRNIQPLF